MTFNQLVREFNQLHRRFRILVKAADLKRNVIIHDDPKFEGEWVAIPMEDFENLRKVLENLKGKRRQHGRTDKQ